MADDMREADGLGGGSAPVRITGPSGLVAAVPFLIGFEPAESVVLVFTRSPSGTVVLCLRVDLPSDGAEAVTQLISEVRRTVRRAIGLGARLDRVQTAIFSADASRLPHADLVAGLSRVLAAEGLDVAEGLCVHADRWWSFSCSDGCCPGTGHASNDAWGVKAAFDLVTAGLGYVANRAALARQLAPDPGLMMAADEIAAALATCRQHRDSGRADTRWRREIEDGLLAWLCCTRSAQAPETAEAPHERTLALWACSLSDSRVREPILHRLLFEGGARHRSRRLTGARTALIDMVRRVPVPEVAPVAAVLAAIAWQQGDGAFARMAGERALAADPRNTLARLVLDAASSGVPPSEWELLMGRFTPAMLRGSRRTASDVTGRRTA